MAVAECLKKVWRGPTLQKDRGYAWVILAMSFLSHSVHLGFSLALLGNLTIIHQTQFGITLQQSSTIGSVHTGLLFLFGPVASVLVKKLGCRITEIAGGVCLIVGIGVSSLSTESWHAYVLFGVLAAFGVSTTYTATSEILAHHFDRHKYLAFSLAVLGYYVGMAVWPIVSQKLLNDYGYSQAMGIMAILHTVHIVAGILFYQPRADNHTATEHEKGELEGKDNQSELEADQKKGEDNPALDTDDIDLTVEKDPHQKRDKDSEQDTSHTDSSESTESAVTKHNVLNDFKILFRSGKVWALLISGLLWNITTTTFLILINDFVLNTTDMDSEAVALGVTIIGVSNIVGCLIVIGTSSLDFDRLRLHVACISLYSLATITFAFVNGKAMYYALTAVWGLGQGALIANLLAVLYDFCGTPQLAVMFGLHLCAEGIGALIGAPISGAIEKVSSAKYGIIFAGACGILGALVVLPVAIVKAKKARAAEGLTLKALVLERMPGEQHDVIEKIKEAAGPEYPHLHHIQHQSDHGDSHQS